MQGARIARLAALAGAGSRVPWYIMTSAATDAPTKAFFEKQNYFGLPKEDVMFFSQAVMPCLTNEGKIMLSDKHVVATAPNGNGGVYAALRTGGVLADMEKRGVDAVHMYCVDNCLARPGDPTFIGYCLSKNADAGVKCVPREDPDEPVGLFCRRGGAPAVVEYSEVAADVSAARDADGKLKFEEANIANHFFSRDFLEKMAAKVLAPHVARKKIAYVTDEGEVVKPTKPSGIKLELFVFDVFGDAERMACLIGARQDDFSPLKNAPGHPQDSPDTSRVAYSEMCKRWVRAAGGAASEDPAVLIEVSPSVSLAGEGDKLKELVAGKDFSESTLID